MARWQPDAQGRLQHAAMELIVEQGYDGTTVAGIAERAGLTERTFFRHFADKREVLFAGQTQFTTTVLDAVRAAPPGLAPLDAVVAGLSATAPMFDERRTGVRARQEIIDAHPDLQERERTKMAGLGERMTAVLRDRGAPPDAAVLAAAAGVAVFGIAFSHWVADDGGRGLEQHIRSAVVELRAVTARGA